MVSRNEIIFNTLIDAAAEEALRQEMDEMPSCDDLDKIYSPTPEMDKKIRRLIKKVEAIQRIKKILILTGKISVVFIAFMVVVSTVLFSVEASRNYILNIYIRWNDDHSSFEFNDNSITTQFDSYIINYVPEGFILDNVFSNDIVRKLTYANEKNEKITIFKSFADSSSLTADNERNNLSIITINGNEAYLFISNDEDENNVLIWKNENVAFQIISTIDINNIIKIAENILKK